MKTMYPLHKFTHDEIAQFRMKVLKFFDQHGAKATREAFDVARPTIYVWKKKLKLEKSLMALTPQSTRPKTTRRMQTDQRILDFISNLRENNPRFGKRKIKILLDVYCRELGIAACAVSTIGKIIKRNNLFFSRSGRVYHNPNQKPTIPGKKLTKERIKDQKVLRAGELIQIDTVVRFDLGIKRYILTAIDLYCRFSFAFAYMRLSSEVALDFFRKLELVAPFKIKAVKTDNGLEFLANFHQYLVKSGIRHYFSYPKTPTSNAYVERFNRTIQEEFVEANLDSFKDTQIFNQKLMDYLLFYNTIRPHQSLGYLTPMQYLVKEEKSKMYGAHTFS